MFQFTTRSGNICPKNMFHGVNQGKTKEMYISDVTFLNFVSQIFVNVIRDFQSISNY